VTLSPGRFDALTFDCYGTLIDWERGILDALHTAFGRSAPADPQSLLELFAATESATQTGPFRPYRSILVQVVLSMGSELGVVVGSQAAEDFAASVPRWPAFADSVESLRSLSSRYRLAIVSNVDDDLFAGSAARLGVAFDEVVTAQQVRSYKPAPDHFHEVLRRLALPRDRVLHVAQSLFHDIAPARELGLTTVWVNRRAGREGGGATPPNGASPDFEVPDLRTLIGLLGVPSG
jgi:2-haloacid dehalogenase